MPAFPRFDLVVEKAREAPQGMAALAPRDSAADAFQNFVVEAWSLLSAALAITALRIGFRISALGIRHLGWDDYLVCLGALFYVIETTLAYNVGHVAHGLANGGMTDEERAALSPDDPEFKMRWADAALQAVLCTAATNKRSWECLPACPLDPNYLDESCFKRNDRFISNVDTGSDAVEIRIETVTKSRLDDLVHIWHLYCRLLPDAEHLDHHAPMLSLRSSRSGHSATGFRTIGGGDGNGGVGVRYRRPPQSVNPLPTKLTVTESTEQLVDDGIELQSGKSPAPSERATEEPHSTSAATTSARDTEAAAPSSAH
ncbi:hypothetical protein PWT90_08392 [Aphanocladium album]|nr:hypothetical protein PWT90_08392 [Aphanocladium album]